MTAVSNNRLPFELPNTLLDAIETVDTASRNDACAVPETDAMWTTSKVAGVVMGVLSAIGGFFILGPLGLLAGPVMGLITYGVLEGCSACCSSVFQHNHPRTPVLIQPAPQAVVVPSTPWQGIWSWIPTFSSRDATYGSNAPPSGTHFGRGHNPPIVPIVGSGSHTTGGPLPPGRAAPQTTGVVHTPGGPLPPGAPYYPNANPPPSAPPAPGTHFGRRV